MSTDSVSFCDILHASTSAPLDDDALATNVVLGLNDVISTQ